MVLGAVLGPMIESNYRRSLMMGGGDLSIFVRDPISALLLGLALLMLVTSFIRETRNAKKTA